MDSSLQLTTSFISFAKNLGFIAVGFSRPHRPAHFDSFLRRLADRKHGDMTWLERNLDLREDPSKLLEGCQTIISLAYPYPNFRHHTEDGYWVARYADPSREDYHFRLKKLGEDLFGSIQKDYPGSKAMVCVDSSPILEKSIAWQSGLGFIGKNTLLVIPGYGSYLFLVEILTTAPLKYPTIEPMRDQCGTCTAACPMSIDVTRRVREGRLETASCILCGSCVDACPSKTIRYSFSAGK